MLFKKKTMKWMFHENSVNNENYHFCRPECAFCNLYRILIAIIYWRVRNLFYIWHLFLLNVFCLEHLYRNILHNISYLCLYHFIPRNFSTHMLLLFPDNLLFFYKISFLYISVWILLLVFVFLFLNYILRWETLRNSFKSY